MGSGSETAIQKQYTYTDAGNVLKQIDSAGNYRLYDYDESDRLTAVNYFDKNGSQTLRTEYTYDILGNVTAMADYRYENGRKVLYRYTEKKYDEFGKVISEAEVDCEGNIPTEAELTAKRMVYTYDDDDCLTSVSYPNGFNSRVNGLTFEYGEYNRLKKIHAVTESGSKVLREYTYDTRGKVTEIKDNREALGGTGYALKTYGYDRLERPDAIIVTDSEGESEVEKYTYLYDENNQIVEEGKINNYAKEKLDEKWTYSYDSLGRLLTTTVIDNLSSRTKTEKSYSYDNAGNRLTETENGVTVQSAYNGLNQMVRSGMSNYTYDANGNLIKESGNGLVKDYSYDADNRLDTAMFTENGQETLTQKNTYNGEGQRISKTENNETTRYSYQNGSVVYTESTTENASLNLLGDLGNVIASDRINGALFYNKDMRGSTTSILDRQGTSKVTYQYSDFGETTADGDFYNEICYTGGIYDKSTGLYYLNARYYDPDDGRFLTEDTYRGDAQNPATLHLYVYCANNPINYVDPSGHLYIKRAYVAILIDAAVSMTGAGWMFNAISSYTKSYIKKNIGKKISKKTFLKTISKKLKSKSTQINSIKRNLYKKIDKIILDYRMPYEGVIKRNLRKFMKKYAKAVLDTTKSGYISGLVVDYASKVMHYDALDCLLSIGGFFAGAIEIHVDGNLDGKIYF